MWDLGPVPPVELTATQRYADHSSATMKLFLDAKASADTFLDLCVLHIKVNSKQQLYICYWSWNTNGVNWFQVPKQGSQEQVSKQVFQETHTNEANNAKQSDFSGS